MANNKLYLIPLGSKYTRCIVFVDEHCHGNIKSLLLNANNNNRHNAARDIKTYTSVWKLQFMTLFTFFLKFLIKPFTRVSMISIYVFRYNFAL